jgi:hypothetical protein
MKPFVVKGATDQTVYVFIQDSGDTTVAGLTGLVYNAAGLVASYVRPLGSRVAITLATQTVTGAHADGGFVEVDATNMPGIYRLDLPDAAVASGVISFVVMLKGATNQAPLTLEIPLVAVNLQDSVRAGLTALPNAAADAAGGLPVSDAGGLDLDTQRADVAAILVDTGTTLPATLGTPVGASLAADLLTIDNLVDDLETRLTAARAGYLDNISAGAIATAAQAAAIQADTDDIQTRLPAGLVGGRMDAAVGSIQSTPVADIADAVWDEAQASHTTAGTTGASLNNAASAGDPWATALPGAYGAGTAGALLGAITDPVDESDLFALIATIDTVVDAIKAKTDNLPVDPADASDIAAAFAAVNAALVTIDDFLDTEIAAIKAKTDNLPAAPAATGDIPTAVQNADALLGRTISGGANGGRTVTSALRALRNKVAIVAGTMTVYEEDDATSAFTAAVTTAAGNPIASIDPA